jgi:hypothetical protein
VDEHQVASRRGDSTPEMDAEDEPTMLFPPHEKSIALEESFSEARISKENFETCKFKGGNDAEDCIANDEVVVSKHTPNKTKRGYKCYNRSSNYNSIAGEASISMNQLPIPKEFALTPDRMPGVSNALRARNSTDKRMK